MILLGSGSGLIHRLELHQNLLLLLHPGSEKYIFELVFSSTEILRPAPGVSSCTVYSVCARADDQDVLLQILYRDYMIHFI